MACKERITISVDDSLLSELDRTAAERHASRSALFAEALRTWQRVRLQQALARGYQEMAEEDRETAEANLRSSVETLG
jgi:metal-responsive CopG/Arc/MetJ family transcriptional regulator